MKRHIIFALVIILTLALAGHVSAAATYEVQTNACYVKTPAYMDFVAPAGANTLVYRVYKQYDHCVAYYSGGNLVAEIGHEIVHGECSLCGYQNHNGEYFDVGTVGTPVS